MAFKLLGIGKGSEKETVGFFGQHMQETMKARKTFMELGAALISGNFKVVNEKNEMISNFERKADSIRRSIGTHLYEGAFMPLMRTFLFDFAESLDDVIDGMQDAAERIVYLKGKKLPKKVKDSYKKMFDEISKIVVMLDKVVKDLFAGKKGIREQIKKAKELEHNLDMLEKAVFDEVLFGKKTDPVTTWLICDIAHLLASVGDAVEESCDKIAVLRLMRQA